MKKNIILTGLLAVLSLNSYAGTVTPSASFGTATTVVVAQNGSTSLVMARNAKGDVFVGKAQYVPDKGTYYGTYETNAHVRSATNGAVSNGTVKATITQQVPKRKVIDEILQKARAGGKALGKGAASAGRLVGLNTPYGRAFALATAALEGSKFFWDEDKGDFVRYDNDNLYVVLSTKKASSSFPSPLDDKTLEEFCSKNECQKVAVIEGKAAADKAAKEFCQSRTYNSYGQTYNFDSIGWSGYCYDSKKNTLGSIGVKVIRWVDTVPITADEFFDESEPDADNNPNEWVETSGVEPTDEPEVEVPAGTVAQTDPYTDPKDGKAKQTRWDFEGKGRVRETTIERPDLTPGSPEAPELKPPAEELPQDPDNGDKDKDKDKDGEDEKDKEKPETEDLCEKNPDVLACDKQPEKPELDEFPEIPTETVNLKFTPDSVFPNAGQCPAPVSFQAMGATYQISTQPICDVAEKLRPLIIALAYLVAAFFVIRTIKSETA